MKGNECLNVPVTALPSLWDYSVTTTQIHSQSRLIRRNLRPLPVGATHRHEQHTQLCPVIHVSQRDTSACPLRVGGIGPLLHVLLKPHSLHNTVSATLPLSSFSPTSRLISKYLRRKNWLYGRLDRFGPFFIILEPKSALRCFSEQTRPDGPQVRRAFTATKLERKHCCKTGFFCSFV